MNDKSKSVCALYECANGEGFLSNPMPSQKEGLQTNIYAGDDLAEVQSV